jgi:hypothetical protein
MFPVMSSEARVAGAQCLRGVRRAAASFEGSASDAVHDHAPADAWRSSKAVAQEAAADALARA